MDIKELKKVETEVIAKIKQAATIQEVEDIRIFYFSKKGVVAALMSELRNIAPTERPTFGQAINELKQTLESALQSRKDFFLKEALLTQLETEKIDVTLPGYQLYSGSIHPLNQVIEEVEDLFVGLGYEIATGPELELDYYNFEMMNLAKDHPARAMQDSFYTDENTLLRTHTSPVQARVMLAKKGKPFKIICPGKVYRRDDDDPTHSHQFMQIEGMVIDQNISFANLKDTLLKMVRHLFGENREIRLRPSYFPFTEPSVEVDVTYRKKDKSTGYIEVLGAGMVHPEVLRMGGYDPNKFQGFAFGIGVERIAFLRYQIDDIRHFYTNDVRFINQFKGESKK